MFFRVKPSGPRRYLQLVENTRDGTATRQRVLATLGRIDDAATNEKLDALLESGARFSDTALLISSLQSGTLALSWHFKSVCALPSFKHAIRNCTFPTA